MIENVIGSEFDDRLAGDDNRNSLTGRNDDDETIVVVVTTI
ncbi:MAG: hypothetical protein AAFO95_21240 [Cyanobacteria bacterium J06600_6]